MKEMLRGLFDGCMRAGRCTSIPFSMGPLGSPIAQLGVQITDSAYVAVNMRIMTRMGATPSRCSADSQFVPVPAHRRRAARAGASRTWRGRATPTSSTSCTSPRSARSGATAAATAATPCSARSAWPCASPRHGARPGLARRAHADHGRHRPEGEKTYVAAAFPSACGKTNFAMLVPPPAFPTRAGR